MLSPRLALFTLTACLVSACGAQILEDVGDVNVPRTCGEPAKLFKNFLVQAKKISWSGPRGSRNQTSNVTIELVFENATKWPLALSNSGEGILYSVEYALLGKNGFSYTPRETGGVANGARLEKPGDKQKSTTDVHLRIKPGQKEEGKLVFEVPRGDYILVIERQFAGKPVPGNREDHQSLCKISQQDFSAPRPARPGGILGVY